MARNVPSTLLRRLRNSTVHGPLVEKSEHGELEDDGHAFGRATKASVSLDRQDVSSRYIACPSTVNADRPARKHLVNVIWTAS